jgi:DGQHR domain-containing protein
MSNNFISEGELLGPSFKYHKINVRKLPKNLDVNGITIKLEEQGGKFLADGKEIKKTTFVRNLIIKKEPQKNKKKQELILVARNKDFYDEYRNRKRKFVEVIIDPSSPEYKRFKKTIKVTIDQTYIKEKYKNGMQRIRVYKKDLKDQGKEFQDEIWSLFADMGFNILNKEKPKFKIFYTSRFDQQIDVYAECDDTILVCECKDWKSKQIDGAIGDIKRYKSRMEKKLKRYRRDKEIKFILWVKGLTGDPTKRTIENAHKSNIILLGKEAYEYYREISDRLLRKPYHMADIARYLLLGSDVFQNVGVMKCCDSFSTRAIKEEMGGRNYYMFNCPPIHILRRSRLHHRRAVEENSFQRLVESKRLHEISDWLEKGQNHFFPNAVIINFEENITFNKGRLTFPDTYGSVSIIDGQHRLFGYYLSEKQYTDKIAVIAFKEMNLDTQGGIFIEINDKQKTLDSSLRWDLKGTFFKNADPKSIEFLESMESDIVRKLSNEQSPLKGLIKYPSYKIKGENEPHLTMVTLCNALEKTFKTRTGINMLLDDKYFKETDASGIIDRNETINKAYKSLNWFFKIVSNYTPDIKDDWDKGKSSHGKKGFTCTNNGIAILIYIFTDILRELDRAPKKQSEINDYLVFALNGLIKIGETSRDAWREDTSNEHKRDNKRARLLRCIELGLNADYPYDHKLRHDWLKKWEIKNRALGRTIGEDIHDILT